MDVDRVLLTDKIIILKKSWKNRAAIIFQEKSPSG